MKNKKIFNIVFRGLCLFLAACLTASFTHNIFNTDFIMGGCAVFLIQIAFNKGEKR